jgi:hypothetical protein
VAQVKAFGEGRPSSYFLRLVKTVLLKPYSVMPPVRKCVDLSRKIVI